MNSKRTTKYLLVTLVTIALMGCQGNKEGLLGSGSFEATEVLVSSEVNGKVLQWDIAEGSEVKAGEMVGLIDTLQLYLKREALLKSAQGVRANRPSVEVQTKALEVQLEDLRANQRRIAQLLGSGAATQKQLDDINANIEALQSQITAHRKTLSNQGNQITAQSSALEIQVAQVEDMIQRSQITSPIDGTITDSYIQRGELAGAGRPLFRVADLSTLYLRAYIQNRQLATLKLGDEVIVRVDGSGKEKRTYQGVVTWISSTSEFTPKTVQTDEERSNLVYAIKVRVTNDGYLRIGMYGEVLKK